jgi:hypothetical protein
MCLSRRSVHLLLPHNKSVSMLPAAEHMQLLAVGAQNKLKSDLPFRVSYVPGRARYSANGVTSGIYTWPHLIDPRCSQLKGAILNCQGQYVSSEYTLQMARNNHLCW